MNLGHCLKVNFVASNTQRNVSESSVLRREEWDAGDLILKCIIHISGKAKMCSNSIKNFDELYSKICSKLRESGESIKAIELISKSSSDYNRLQWLLQADPQVVALFCSSITPHFLNKDEIRAKELLSEACSQNSLPLINQALQLCYNGEETMAEAQLSPCNIRDEKNLQKFVNLSQVESNDVNLVSEIFSRRSTILFQYGKFEPCIRDTFRCVQYGARKSYEIVLRLALSYKQLGFFTEAIFVAQYALDVLKCSNIDNEFKCKETVRLVSIIKEIQQSQSVSSPSGKYGEKEKGGNSSKPHHHNTVEPLKYELFEGPHNILGGGTSSVLKLEYTEERGRHVIAQRNIPPGSTLIIESPFSWSVTPTKYPTVCQYCLASQLAISDGIPCPECAAVIFCNEECRDNAMRLFHKYECKILKLLDSSEKLGRMSVIVFRTVAQVPLEEILATHNSLIGTGPSPSPSLSQNQSMMMGFNKTGKLDSSNYISVFAQTTNSHNRNGADLLKRAYAAIYLVLCLRFVGYFNPGEGESNASTPKELSETEKIVASILLRHLQSASCNAYGINHVSPIEEQGSQELQIEEIAGATFPIISTTNHSCNPNIYRFNLGKKCIVNSLHEIHQGEQVFDSYGPIFTTTPITQRQHELENQYCFKCNCIACINNWPTFQQLRNHPLETPPAYKCPHCEIGKLDVSSTKDQRKCPNCGKLIDFKKIQKHLKTAQEKYSRAKDSILKQKLESPTSIQKCICNYIVSLQKMMVMPTKELVEAQEVLKLFWNLSIGNRIID